MKKIISVLMLLTLVLSLGTAAMAAEETGSITINGVHAGNQYDIYKLLDLESYDTVSGAYSYKINANWAGFFATDDALKYVAIDGAGYVTWINGEDDASVAAFAQLALAYAKANSITSVKSTTSSDDASVVFEGLELGYYLVDSTVGALCGLTTTNPNASINAKNGIPTIDKQVMEDSTGIYGDISTADIGQTVYYQTVINVAAGAENFVYHDKMSETLTFDSVSKIELVVPGSTTNTTLTEGTDYTVEPDPEGECTFEIRFSNDFCAKLDANDKIIIHYSAMLNRNAVIAGNGNPNDAWLTFGENEYNTTHDSTITYTFAIDIVKTDSQNTLIDGAQFKIYDAATGGNEIAVVPLMKEDNTTPILDENGNPMYRRARADETGVAIEVKDGIVTIIGFDNGTYYLEETVAPAGYNKLTARQKFIIADSNLEAVFNNGVYSTGSGVHVVNKTGSMLPETGGVGTTIFYTLGGILVLGAIVLLVTKKRMKGEN